MKPCCNDFSKILTQLKDRNDPEDLKIGYKVVVKLLDCLLEIEDQCDATGVERSLQAKKRTIFSQNAAVNNALFSLDGQIEDLFMNLGYIPVDLGNPDLKPNFMFKHTEKEAFKELREKR